MKIKIALYTFTAIFLLFIFYSGWRFFSSLGEVFRFDPSDASLTIYSLKIPKTDLYLLEFDVWHGLDSHNQGYSLTNKPSEFKWWEDVSFDCNMIQSLNQNELHTIKIDHRVNDQVEYPYRELKEIAGYEVIVDHYLLRGSSRECMNRFYKFDSCYLREDTLYLTGVHTIAVGMPQPESTKKIILGPRVKMHEKNHRIHTIRHHSMYVHPIDSSACIIREVFENEAGIERSLLENDLSFMKLED